MMSKKKIKVGDRVRITHDGWDDNDTPIACGTVGVVADIIGNSVTIKTDRPLTYSVDIDEVELISPTDPRTAFLQELKELLIKYNVEIHGGCNGYDSEYPFVRFDSKDFNLTYCDEYDGKFEFPLTPDNVMDYEK